MNTTTSTDTLDHMAVKDGRLVRVAVATTVDPITAQVRASRPIYSIRFPLVKERTGNKRGPRFRLVPDKHNLTSARACAAGMVTASIHRRDIARKHAQEALRWAEMGDLRQANIERLNAERERQTMRSHALWARVFAGHIEDHDARLEELSRRSMDLLTRSFRASNLSERWRRVQLMKFTPRLTDAARARIERVMHRIALQHDAINPYGHTLAHHTQRLAA